MRKVQKVFFVVGMMGVSLGLLGCGNSTPPTPTVPWAFLEITAPPEGGQILLDPSPDYDDMYESGTEVMLKAVPNEGWRFDKWEVENGEIQDLNAPETSVVIDGPVAVEAYFVEEVPE